MKLGRVVELNPENNLRSGATSSSNLTFGDLWALISGSLDPRPY